MSYALRLAGDAQHVLSRLPVVVQEEVHDLLDRLAVGADETAMPAIGSQQLVYKDEASLYFVYMLIAASAEHRTLSVEYMHWVVEV